MKMLKVKSEVQNQQHSSQKLLSEPRDTIKDD